MQNLKYYGKIKELLPTEKTIRIISFYDGREKFLGKQKDIPWIISEMTVKILTEKGNVIEIFY